MIIFIDNKQIEVISGFVTLIISIFYFIASFYLETLVLTVVGPEFFPRIIAVIMFICSVILIITGLKDLKKEKLIQKDGCDKEKFNKKVIFTFLILTLYVLLLDIISYPLATIGYLIIQMAILAPEGKRNYRLFTIIALITGIGVYMLFRYSFNIMLPLGIFKNLF